MNPTTPAHGSGTTPADGSANVHVFKTGRIASRPNRVLSVGGIPIPPTPPRSPRKKHAVMRCLLAQSAESEKHIRSERGFCAWTQGTGDGESPAAGGGPQDITEGRRAARQRPTYGRVGADVRALRTGTRPQTGRNPARLGEPLTDPGAMHPNQIQTVTKLRIRRACPRNAAGLGVGTEASADTTTREILA